MSTSDKEALERIVLLAQQQVDLIKDGAARPDVDLAGLKSTAADMLLAGIASHVRDLDGETFEKFRASQVALTKDAIDVRRHLIALGDGWSCKFCKNDVVGAAIIGGLKRRKLKLELRCKACGRTSAIDRLGMAAFKQKFGHLVQPSWDPTKNGFVWMES